MPECTENYNILMSAAAKQMVGICFSDLVAKLEQPGDVRSDIIFMGNWEVCDETSRLWFACAVIDLEFVLKENGHLG